MVPKAVIRGDTLFLTSTSIIVGRRFQILTNTTLNDDYTYAL